MMKSALMIILGFAIFGKMDARPHCTYIFYYQPVCGNDGKTYINSGHLTCEKLKHQGLVMISAGQCPTDAIPHEMDRERQQWDGLSESLNTAQQPNNPELAPVPHNENTQPGNAFDNTGHTRTGQMHHGHGNYPGDGMRWDNSREYPDNSFELHIGGGKGSGMAKGLIAGAVLGKVASDMSKNKQNKQNLGGAGIGSNPFQQQPNSYGQQPNLYGHQPNSYGQQPNNYGQQPNPYGQQPNPYGQQPKPYPVQPNPYAQQPKPYPVQPSPNQQQPNPYAPSNPANSNSKPSPYNPYAPSAPAAPAPAPKPANTGNGNSNTNNNKGHSNQGRTPSRKSSGKSGGSRRKGRSVA